MLAQQPVISAARLLVTRIIRLNNGKRAFTNGPSPSPRRSRSAATSGRFVFFSAFSNCEYFWPSSMSMCSRGTATATGVKTLKIVEEPNIEGSAPSSKGTVSKKCAVANEDEEQMLKSKDVLVKYGFSTEVIQDFPDLLLLPPAAMENYVLIMKETGFSSIRPFWIASYPSIARKTLISIRKSGLIGDEENVIENLFAVLELPSDIRSNIRAVLPINPDELSLKSLRLLILEHFLAYRLSSDVDTCRDLISKYPRIKHRAYDWISKNIKILLSDYKFNPEKLIRNGTLLQVNPANLREILNTIPTLAGIPIREAAVRRPKTIMAQASSLRRLQDLFAAYGISDEAVAKYPELFTLSPDTIAARLKVIVETPELHAFLTHPRIGRILYYFKIVKKRLEYFQSLDVTGVSLHVLSLDREKFSDYVERGDLRHKGGDLVQFLAGRLGLPRKQVRAGLSLNPHWLQIPTRYAEEVLRFLEQTFTLDQLRSTIPIVLYPIDKVQAAVQSTLAVARVEKSHPQYLHLVLYELEKEFHFSGDGIWTWYHQLRHETTESEDHQSTTVPS